MITTAHQKIGTPSITTLSETIDNETSRSRIPGNTGIWVGIFCVLVEFLMLFSVYFIARIHNPEAFLNSPDKLLTIAGTTITLFLLSSGYCMVKAINAIRSDQSKTAFRWVNLAIILGFAYPIVKYFELSWYAQHGINVKGGIFFGTYYYLTLNHLVHVTWGLMGLIFVSYRTVKGGYTSESYSGLEAAALYWHTTDILWIVLFTFFYILR
ncbi:MAG: cytochrome c oxidase subunit 3 family protein [Gammaproteobacteria bacterium]|nr:cytochrome c oxidase subunit 3 family protein [Gammaproteobacteria bacterium]